ncbi:MAG TPA: VOC family protein [Methanomassiliicoccales archaeon]
MAKQAKVTHFEVPADDMDRAKKFYTEVFGWQMFPPDPVIHYQSVGTTSVNEKFMPKEPGAINGGIVPREGPNMHPIVTLEVDDIDAALESVKKHGGKITMKKMAAGTMGFFAYFEDSEGNIMGLWETTGGM